MGGAQLDARDRTEEPNVNLILDERDWTLAGALPWTLVAGTPSAPPSVTVEDTTDADADPVGVAGEAS